MGCECCRFVAMEEISFKDKEVLTLDECCLYSGLSKSFLYKATSKRELKHSKPNGKIVFVKRNDLIDFLLRNSSSAPDNREITQIEVYDEFDAPRPIKASIEICVSQLGVYSIKITPLSSISLSDKFANCKINLHKR